MSTLGFDEKFALRGVLRNGVAQGDSILLLLTDTNEQRPEKAYNLLREILEKAFGEVNIEKISVPLSDFSSGISYLRKIIKRYRGEKVIINMSGGQRILLMMLMAAVLSLDLDAEIEIETEDLQKVFRFPLNMLKPTPLDELDSKLLAFLKDGRSTKIKEVALALGISKPSAWRRLERLRSKGLIVRDEKSRYSITELGVSRFG